MLNCDTVCRRGGAELVEAEGSVFLFFGNNFRTYLSKLLRVQNKGGAHMFGSGSFSGSFSSQWQAPGSGDGACKGSHEKGKGPIKRFDSDGDGALNKEEFGSFQDAVTKKMAANGKQKPHQIFDELDLNGDGKVDDLELREARKKDGGDKFHGQMPDMGMPHFLEGSSSIRIEQRSSIRIDGVNTSLSKEEKGSFISNALKGGFSDLDVFELGFLDLLNSLESESS